MVSASTDEIEVDTGPVVTLKGYESNIRMSQKPALEVKIRRNKLQGILAALYVRPRFLKLKFSSMLASPSAKFRRVAEERDEVSQSVPSLADQSSPRQSSIPFVSKINWTSLRVMCKEWIKNPVNMALLIWITCVAVSGAILFMVMTGMLNGVLPKKSQRNTWFEVNNQILNALFTLMCLLQHPRRFYHLALLCRWSPEDVLKLRKIYCKNGAYKPQEWSHMMVVVVLLHVNCFAQYALCGLNLGYSRAERPPVGVGLCISVAIAAPVIASVYNIRSPLGRDYETDQEALNQIISVGVGEPSRLRLTSLEQTYSFVAREDQRVPEIRPEWVGGLLDFWDNISLAYLSLFCSFCVFGWNMDRLGFGNMYVHITTFILLCIAPFFIFNLAAININNEVIRETLGLTGIVLCIFGLLYGGFWRIQMRERFNLPANKLCCGKPAVTDCFQWLCCCWCSLAQEVRTADFYNVVEDKFYLKGTNGNSAFVLSPLPREDGSPLFTSSPSSPYQGKSSPSVLRMASSPSPSRFSGEHNADGRLPMVEEEPSVRNNAMKPPAPFVGTKIRYSSTVNL